MHDAPDVEDLVIIGTGGHGREALDVVEAINAVRPRWRVLGFVDDTPGRVGHRVRGELAVLGGQAWLLDSARRDVRHVIAIGSGRARARLAAPLRAAGRRAAVLVHPTAVVPHGADLGEGVILAAHATLGCDVRLGAHTHLNLGASVSHDGQVGAFCHLAPGARCAGNVTLGEGVELGIGAVAVPGVTIGDWTIVGAGAAVVRSLPPGVIAAGVPARVLRERPPA